MPNIYFTQISNLSEARFATSVMAEGIAFCIEKDNDHYVSPTQLKSFQEWLVGSEWIAALSGEPNQDVRDILDYFEIKTALVGNALYRYEQNDVLVSEGNLIKKLSPLQEEKDFHLALKEGHEDVLLFGTKEEEVGMASMDRWLDYFEALEIL